MSIGSFTGLDGQVYDVVPRTIAPPVDPVKPPIKPPATGRRGVLWHFGWKAAPLGRLPDDVAASLRVVSCAMSQSGGSGTGKLTAPPGVTKAEVAHLVSGGVDVLACIGGSGDGGIRITSSAQAQQALTSWRAMRDATGYTGIDLDLEGSGGTWTPSAVLEVANGVISDGGKVGITSSLWGGRLQAWGGVAQSLGVALLYWARMFYDFPEARDARLSGVVAGDLPQMRRYLARDDQLVAAFMPIPPEGYANASPLDVITSAYAAARHAYPDAGYAVWEDYIDGRLGFRTVRSLAAV